MVESKNPPDHSALWLALQNLTHEAGIQRDDLLEALAGELSALRHAWGANLYQPPNLEHTKALEHVRAALRASLGMQIDKLPPPNRVDRRKFIYSIFVCFNMQTDQAHAQFRNKDLSAGGTGWQIEHQLISV